jgi:hypothetical protein
MPVFLTTLALFGSAFAVHFILWKVRLPKSHLKTLLLIFVVIFFGWLAWSLIHHAPLLFIAHVATYYWSVAFFYTITYTGVEGDSPTLSLMRFINGAGPAGRSLDEIEAFMAVRPFLQSRLTALIDSAMVTQVDDRYVLNGAQPLSFRLILGFRRIYGAIPKGG